MKKSVVTNISLKLEGNDFTIYQHSFKVEVERPHGCLVTHFSGDYSDDFYLTGIFYPSVICIPRESMSLKF